MSRLNPVHYLLLVIAFSWTPWYIAIVTHSPLQSPVGMICVTLGCSGPTLAALLLLHQSTKHHRNNFWHRLIDIRRISFAMGCVIILLMPLLITFSIFIASLFGHTLHHSAVIEFIQQHPSTLVAYALALLIAGPVVQEPGWRGYWLDTLGRKHSLFTASIIIGCTWAIWHLPLFHLTGYTLRAICGNTLELAVFFGKFVPEAIILTWIYCCTNRSILAAILFHVMVNITGFIIHTSTITVLIEMILLWVFAAGVVIFKRQLFFSSETSDHRAPIHETGISTE